MRQTPFGVWNDDVDSPVLRVNGAAMRQTPFGVWNLRVAFNAPSQNAGCNEADTFRRLEPEDKTWINRYWSAAMRQTPFGVWNVGLRQRDEPQPARCNEADTFRRLEPARLVGGLVVQIAALQ